MAHAFLPKCFTYLIFAAHELVTPGPEPILVTGTHAGKSDVEHVPLWPVASNRMAARVDRFDHAVIVVRDLDAAMTAYRDMGFEVAPGGKHTGRGTHNAIIRFGLDYIELLAIYDADEERAQGGDLSSFLERDGGGLLAFAVATSQIDEIAAGWSSDFAPVGAPEPMERVRPDGYRLSWRLLIPGGSPWGKPWPFVIQWDNPDAERLDRDKPGTHANGATGVARVTVAAKSIDRLLPLYASDLGLTVDSHSRDEAVLELGRAQVRLVTGDAERPVQIDLTTATGITPLRPPAV